MSERLLRILTVSAVGFTFFGLLVLPVPRASRAFFEASSQIIPVLLLALAFEARALGARPDASRGMLGYVVDLLSASMMLLILISAELGSLDALATMKEDETHDPRLPYAAIIAAMMGLFMQILHGAHADRRVASHASRAA
jgi:hypothetical protein